MKKLIAISCIVMLTIISVSFIQDEPGFKNLKVLSKKTTHDQMDTIMKQFAKSLGVKCNFCHVPRTDDAKKLDFASDENEHKDIARSMLRMTNRINKKFFKGDHGPSVTCYTCHNGHEEPEKFPPADKDDE